MFLCVHCRFGNKSEEILYSTYGTVDVSELLRRESDIKNVVFYATKQRTKNGRRRTKFQLPALN